MNWAKMKPKRTPAVAIVVILLAAVGTASGGGDDTRGSEVPSGSPPVAGSGDGRAAGPPGPEPGEAERLPADLRAAVDGIQARYDALRNFRARFTQESRIVAAPTSEIAKGEVFFQKPGKMRWNYDTPEPQEIVISGGRLWQYVPADKQVVIQSFDTSRVEYAFLTGLGNLEKQFRVRWAEPKTRPDDPLLYLELTPRDEQASFTKVVLGIEPQGHRILATEVAGVFGNVTTIRFEKLRDNVAMKSDVFAFEPPGGVDVIDATPGSVEP
jgi:outer membrane lipoprotein carrier protein